MTISITITGETAQEVRANLEGLLNGSPYVSKLAAVPVNMNMTPGGVTYLKKDTQFEANVSDVKTETEVEEKKERKPRGPNKKKEEAKVEAPTPPPATIPTNEELTLVNCRNWVKAVAAEKTLDTAQNVVIGFGVAKVGDLPESKFPEFIKACKEALAKSEEVFA